MVDSSKHKAKATVDLGLSGLLGGDSEDNTTPQSDPQTISTPVSSEINLDREERYSELYSERRWEELVRLSESSLDSDGVAALRARLWWIRAHCEKGSLPLNALLAPLDKAVSRSYLYSDRDEVLHDLLKETVLTYWGKLTESGDQKLAPVVYDKFKPYIDGSSAEDQTDNADSSSRGPQLVRWIAALCLTLVLAAALVLAFWSPDAGFDLFSTKNSSEFKLSFEDSVPENFSKPPEALGPTLAPAQVSMRESISSVLDDLSAKQRGDSDAPVASSPEVEEPKVEKASVDTEGPIEPAEVRDAVTQDQPSSSENEPKPVRAVLGGKDSSRNIFAPEQAPTQYKQPEVSERTTEYDFRKGIYRVSRNVAVWERATRGSRVVAGLLRNDRVFVESEYEGWLKIVSTMDRPGYIPKDAIDVSSWAR